MAYDSCEEIDATPMMPEHGTETHGSPASAEGIREDEGKQ